MRDKLGREIKANDIILYAAMNGNVATTRFYKVLEVSPPRPVEERSRWHKPGDDGAAVCYELNRELKPAETGETVLVVDWGRKRHLGKPEEMIVVTDWLDNYILRG